MLTEIEGELRRGQRSEEPEVPSLQHLDIDHIMPRVWYTYWSFVDGGTVTAGDIEMAKAAERDGRELTAAQDAILGRERLIHTLGNLTLLNVSINRSAQNREYLHKRE